MHACRMYIHTWKGQMPNPIKGSAKFLDQETWLILLHLWVSLKTFYWCLPESELCFLVGQQYAGKLSNQPIGTHADLSMLISEHITSNRGSGWWLYYIVPTKHILQNLFALDPLWPSSSEALGLSHLTNSTGAMTSTSLAMDASCITTPLSRFSSSSFKGWNICIAIANKHVITNNYFACMNAIQNNITHFPQHWNSRWQSGSST